VIDKPATAAYIALGANLGEPVVTLRTALTQLTDMPGILAIESSPFYRSAPVEASGPDFVNAVARLFTTLSPLQLLDKLQALERAHGRQRRYRNAPRTLDLDLLLYGERAIHSERLILPHPRMHERAFVLLPLRDLAPGLALKQGALELLLQGLRDQTIEQI
jgi:2-amino-4-hydroxy-6-hydroxymethyldihydropteridine diphosphokinase